MKVYVPMQTIEGELQPILGVYRDITLAMNQVDEVTQEGMGDGFMWINSWDKNARGVWVRTFQCDGEDFTNEIWPMETII